MSAKSYPVTLGALLDELGADRVIEDSVDVGTIEVGDTVLDPKEPASFTVSIVNTGAGVVADGPVRVPVSTECARCLAPCVLTLEGHVEGFYVLPGREESIPDEQEYELITEGRIDLLPAMRAALAVEAPFAPLHDPECAGICPTCGIDLNVEECTCPRRSTPDNPFAVLEGMFDGQAAQERDRDEGEVVRRREGRSEDLGE